MSKLLTALLVFCAVLFSWYYRGGFEKRVVACAQPITYVIGTFDRQFGVTQSTFLSALSEAEDVWEQPFRGEGLSEGRELFAYAPEGGTLRVNLIYDYRQAVTEELSVLEGAVKEDEADYRAMEARYSQLKSAYSTLKNTYEARVTSLDSMSATYESNVEAWNKGKRNDKREFEALEAQRLALEAELSELKVLEAVLNQKTQELNALVDRLNRLARALNLNVEEYNTVGASRGETFAGGIYSRSSDGEEKIDIYEFQNHDKLVRVLAHELGHALGLENVDDPEAIMYRQNEGEAGTLSDTDLSALKALCNAN